MVVSSQGADMSLRGETLVILINMFYKLVIILVNGGE